MGKRTILGLVGLALLALWVAWVWVGCAQEDQTAKLFQEQLAASKASSQAAPAPSAGTAATPAAAGTGVMQAGGEKAGATEPPKTTDKEQAAGQQPGPGAAGQAKGDTGAKPESNDGKQAAAGGKQEGAAKETQGKETGAAKGKEKEEEAAPATDEEKIKDFMDLDPREVIIDKYAKVAAKHTEPWNADKEDEYIPQTGRVDPLHPVDSAIPDELKPPRTGETNQNEIDTYLAARACTVVVESIRSIMHVHNVLEIGAQKYVSISADGDPRHASTIPVGQTIGPFMGFAEGVMVRVTITVASASESEVVITITASSPGTGASISKDQTFIPREIYR